MVSIYPLHAAESNVNTTNKQADRCSERTNQGKDEANGETGSEPLNAGSNGDVRARVHLPRHY